MNVSLLVFLGSGPPKTGNTSKPPGGMALPVETQLTCVTAVAKVPSSVLMGLASFWLWVVLALTSTVLGYGWWISVGIVVARRIDIQ